MTVNLVHQKVVRVKVLQLMVKKMKNSQKAQVTAFVILGIILLVAIGIFLVLKQQIFSHEPDVPNPLATEESEVVTKYVETCLNQVTKRALIKAGKHGGYIDIPGELSINPVYPFDSDVLYSSFYEIPYWYHMKDENVFMTHQPEIEGYQGKSIKENIERYIVTYMPECIADFNEFKDSFEININGNMNPHVIFTQNSVIAELDYDLVIKPYTPGSDTINIDKFNTKLNIPFIQMYQLATQITETEINNSFIERKTLDLIHAYSDVDPNMLPPLEEVKFFELVSGAFWFRRDVEQKIRYDVLPFLGLIKIINAYKYVPTTAVIAEPYQIFAQGFYNSFKINLDKNSSYPFSADVFYPDSELDFYINSGEEVLQPTGFQSFDNEITKMFKLVIKEYSFNYHLSFPVIIKIHDNTAFNGEGYDFFIALEANIRNSIPATSNMHLYTYKAPKSVSLDDPNHLLNNTIKIRAVNRRTDGPIGDATIIYNCGMDFPVGKTYLNDYGEAIFTGKVPYCAAGGYFRIMKEGFESGIIDYNNLNENENPNLVTEMWPFYKKQVFVWKRTEQDVQTYLDQGHIVKFSAKHEINETDTIMFTINKIKDNFMEDDIPLIGFLAISKDNSSSISSIDSQRVEIQRLYDSGEINQTVYDAFIGTFEEYISEIDTDNLELKMNYTLDLIPGEYHFESFMMTKGPFNLPEKIESFCPGLELFGECPVEEEVINYPETNLSVWITGQSNMTRYISETYIYNDKPLHFFVLEKTAPTTWDEMIDYDLDEYISDKEYMTDIYFE